MNVSTANLTTVPNFPVQPPSEQSHTVAYVVIPLGSLVLVAAIAFVVWVSLVYYN